MASVVHKLVCGLALPWNSNTADIFLVGWMLQRWPFRILNVCQCFSVVDRVYFCPSRQELYKNNTFLIPKTVTIIFPADDPLLNFFFLEMSCGAIPSIAAWFWVQNSEPRFHPPWQPVTGNTHLHCSIDATDSWCLLPLSFLCICQHSWHPMSTDHGIAILFDNCHYPTFTKGYSGA